MTFDLNNFLKNYQPKKINLESYLKCSKLKKYQVLNKKNIFNLVPFRTYIKFIKSEDLFKDENLKDHIRAGGILLAGGTYNEKFIRTKNPKNWTHLLLRYEPKPDLIDGIEIKKEPRIYYIRINKYHIFFRNYSRNLRDDLQFILEKM
jgi:hypothetical protein